MNTPFLDAGENPVADAGAAKHVKMLLGTGMAYEFQPETIATRAFLDGFALGSSALARAESAESKSHPNSSEIRTSESATPDHLRGAAEMARPRKQGGAK